MEKLRRLNGLNIAFLGLGLENTSLLAWLREKEISAQITVCDHRDLNQLPKLRDERINWQTGKKATKNLERFDILFRSPGWPLHDPSLDRAKKLGRLITSPINFFLEICPTKNTIGVTGTKGKGTTATLIYKILRAAKKRVFLGGNIGIAPFSFFSRLRPGDYVVLELSSFQLEDLSVSPRLAIITNFYREHLAPADPNNPNYHQTLAAYWQAKIRIAAQKNNRWLIINEKLRTRISASRLPGKKIFFSSSSLKTGLIGRYNQENIAAAVEVAKKLKIPASKYRAAVARFKNLENRLELSGRKNGVNFYNNSFSTTPESTILDIESFTGPVVLLAGGADKGADFRPLAKIIKKRIKQIILLPGTGTKKISAALENIGYPAENLARAADMAQAVALAKSLARPGDTVLLSTGCASFGIFKNYKERGTLFNKYVRSK